MELAKESISKVFQVPSEALKNIETGPKQEPKIFVGSMNNDQLLRWMNGKVRAAENLRLALREKELLLEEVVNTDSRIKQLTADAAIEVLSPDELALALNCQAEEPKTVSGEITVRFDNAPSGITSPKQSGKRFALTVNGAVLMCFDTNNAVAADYIGFIDATTKALLNDSERLEKEANMSGKTIKHANFKTFGSLPIADPKGL
ncbi:hypothetical protein [Yersinia mollaretii]|uniref:hypothetical protein n=1 Tax=Yersinia mollaretii TaxID=33060 RepID=UPI0005E5F047|nr:hypothetical protein [Yersinia mollaretii]CNF01715.1 Uncharacterised protein [Yersinia mollaretii]